MGRLEKEVPFDQYSRQFIVKQLVDILRKPNQVFKILDVGGYKGWTSEFLPHDEVLVLDLFNVKATGYVKGNALNMDFTDGAFDIVTSFDVIEHIPDAKRSTFIDECYRVASRAVITAGPQSTGANEKAETQLNDLYIDLHKKNHRWLKEHIKYNLPDFKKTEKQLQSKGAKVVNFFSNDLLLWLTMQEMIFINSKYSLASNKLIDLNETYNSVLKYDGGTGPGAYRIIQVALKNKNDLDPVQKLLKEKKCQIPLSARLEILKGVERYEATLLQKMNRQAKNYKKLYKNEQKQTKSLAQENQMLKSELAKYQAKLPYKVKTLTKKYFRKAGDE